jgi:hypothetical protein
VDGPGPTAIPGTGDPLTKAPTPDTAIDPSSLVSAFLGAAAGRIRSDGDLNDANARVLKFLTGTALSTWPKPGGGITVVRLDGSLAPTIVGAGLTYVDASLKPIGVLWTDGTVHAPVNPGPRRLRFTVQAAEAGRAAGFLISDIQVTDGDPLSGMMLEASLLDGRLFSPQLIYFWSADRQGLVPDLRYVPKAGVSREIQYTDVVDWVLGGASDLLRDAVPANPFEGNSVVGPNLVAPDKDGLVVNLTNPLPKGLPVGQVMAQLRWSLRPLYNDAVRLQISSQPQNVDGSSPAFRRYNLADRTSRDETAFCVADGVVRPVEDPTNFPVILQDLETTNKGVVLAALSQDLKAAALVKSDGHLYLGESQPSGRPRVVAATLGGGQTLYGPATSAWTRPVFLPGAGHRVLVGLGGRLYLVGMDGQATAVSTPGPVSAFSVAPDGCRIGLISGGSAFVYSLKGGDQISLGSQGRPIDAGLADCTGIAWGRLERVLIAGRLGGTYQIAEATIDGIIVNNFSQPFSGAIQSLVALPPVAWEPAATAEVALVQTAAGALKVGANSHEGISFGASGAPSPTASSGGASGGLGTPTFPFYLG